MLDEQGRFAFTGEVLDLVERLWCAYEQANGQPQGSRERLVGLAYIVAALQQDVDAVWAALVAAPELQGLELPAALEQALPAPDGGALRDLRAEMARRGWLGGEYRIADSGGLMA